MGPKKCERPKNKDSDNMDFEIRFYEGVLNKQPNFIEALMALGDLYTRKGEFAKGLIVDQKLARLRPEDPIVHYNLACSYSLLQDIDKAFEALQKAVEKGYCDVDYMLKDRDLANLRQDKRFKQYIEKLKSKSPHR